MRNWEQALIGADTTLRDALQTVDRAGSQIALVVDPERRLLGTLSDGDARRALLRGLSLDAHVALAMYKQPTVARVNEDRNAILATMRQLGLQQIPLVNRNGIVVGLELLGDLLRTIERPNWVVIMAGGVGSRLDELTRDTPKPMLKVGTRPLLETIIRGYAEQGFREFYLAVNYKSEQIERHFADGSGLGVNIRYIREKERLGTAGALSLLPERPTSPIFVTNADLLTRENYGRMIESHVESGASATMAVRDYEMQVPFGVVRESDGCIQSIEEKPIQRYVVSAGMYVLSGEALDFVPRGEFIDMPSLFAAMVGNGSRTRCYYIDGYWLDIGRLADYERANMEFADVFR